jgi:ribosomal protein S18 acetylase RimI-like enzyme
VFDDLEAESRGGVDIMKLGVHEPNQRARGLYERLEFRVPQELPDLGFVILRKPV